MTEVVYSVKFGKRDAFLDRILDADVAPGTVSVSNERYSQRTLLRNTLYVGRSSSKVSFFFFSGMEADRNLKVVGGDVAVL